MKKRKVLSARIASFIRRRWLVTLLCFIAIGLTALSNIGYSQKINAEIVAVNRESAKRVAEWDVQIEQIKQRKLEEARKAAEAKQAAAAKQAAEESINNGAAGASRIDSRLCNNATKRNNPASIDVLVNKKHCIQPLGFAPNLVTSNGATLSVDAIEAFNKLFAAAAAAGQPFYVTSSYRSYDTQVSTYNMWVATSGQREAETYSARPGYSEHQTGLAFDVAANGCTLDCFGSTSQYLWFQQNAADYGFIQRYYKGSEHITGYKAEEWHYRYVGVTIAKDMKVKGIKTLEEYWNMPGGDY